MRYYLTVSIIVTLLLTSCSQKIPESQEKQPETSPVQNQETSQPAEPTPPAPVEEVFGKEVTGIGYTLRITDTLVSDKTPDEKDLDLSYIDDTNHLFVISLSVEKAGLNISGMKEVMDILKAEFPPMDTTTLDTTIPNPNQEEVLDSRYSGKIDGTDVSMYTRLVDTGTHYVLVGVGTSDEKYTQNIDTIIKILGSFKSAE